MSERINEHMKDFKDAVERLRQAVEPLRSRERIVAAGGLVVPAWAYQRMQEDQEIWHNGCAYPQQRRWKRRLRNLFAWSKGWGFPLRGGTTPRVRDLMPTFKVVRGGIKFARIEGFDE